MYYLIYLFGKYVDIYCNIYGVTTLLTMSLQPCIDHTKLCQFSLAITRNHFQVVGTEYVLLGQNIINWVDSVKHLCNYFNTQLSDSNDCTRKRSTFIGSVN